MPRPRSIADSPRLRRTNKAASTAAAEILEDRVLPAITILVDYSLDSSGFFNDARARAAIESVAAELGSRLTHHIGELLPGYYKTLKPATLTYDFIYSSAPPDTLRLFAGGTVANGDATNILAQCGSIDNLSTRNFDFTREYAPFTTTMAVGTIWNWDFDGTNTASDAIDFKAVMRHELMHGLGIGQAQTWYKWITSNGSADVFTGPTVRAVAGRNVETTPFGFDGAAHFNQGEYSLMQPFYSDIRRPTAIDWAGLNDIGWEVILPGKYADVFTRANDGTWYAAVSAKGLSKPFEFGKWNESAGWQDVTQGDINGDGLTDVLGRTSTGQWYVGLNGSNGFLNKYFGSWNDSLNPYTGRSAVWQDVKFGDFNGDQLLDVAGRSVNGEWYVGLNTGEGFNTTYWGAWLDALNPADGRSAVWKDVNVGDFNGDGRADIAARASDGGWYVALSLGNGFSTLQWTAWNEAAGWRDVQVADIDANGTSDLIGRASDGGWYVGLSLGDHIAAALPWTRWNEAAGWRDVKIGDFSGDGRLDILGRTSTGEWYVAQNIGGLSFSNIRFGRWTEGAGWRTVLTGDFDSSERTDLLAQASDGTWWLGVNDGTKFAFKLYGNWTGALGFKDFGVTKTLFPAKVSDSSSGGVSGSGNGGGFSYHPENGTASSTAAPAMQIAGPTGKSQPASPAFAPVKSTAAKLVAAAQSDDKSDVALSAQVTAPVPVQPSSLDLFWTLADDETADSLLAAV